jgi:chromosome partitioning protein
VGVKIITVCNQKGGAGKTTLSMHLAGALARRGNRVLVVDADPQSTATRWAASADDAQPFPASVVGLSAADAKVHREVQKFAANYDFIVIDCPAAADSPVPHSALLISDIALVPIIPSPPDMWAAVGIRRVIESVSTVRESLKARLVVNQCQPNTNLAKKVLDILPEFKMQVCRTQINQRVAYRKAAGFGSTVHTLGASATDAINEVESLTDEVLEIVS